MTEKQRNEELELRERACLLLRKKLTRFVRFANHTMRTESAFLFFCREKDEECGGTFPVCTGGGQ